jgi:hypothetical protein
MEYMYILGYFTYFTLMFIGVDLNLYMYPCEANSTLYN